PGELPGDAGAAGGEIAARLAGFGDTGERVRHRLAGDQQDALVAVADFRDVALGHDGPAPVLGDGLDDDVQVGIVAAHPEDRGAAHAVERLQDYVAVLGDELADRALATRRDGGRDEPGEMRYP